MQFHSPFEIKYCEFREMRFSNGLKKPDQVFRINNGNWKKKRPIKLNIPLVKDYDSFNAKYQFSLNDGCLNERISVGPCLYELHTLLSDDEKEEFIEKIFSLYNIIKGGKIPRTFDNHFDAQRFLSKLILQCDHKNKQILDFDYYARKYVNLKFQDEISLYYKLEKDGTYYFFQKDEMFRKERLEIAEYLVNLIDKEKVRILTGVI